MLANIYYIIMKNDDFQWNGGETDFYECLQEAESQNSQI